MTSPSTRSVRVSGDRTGSARAADELGRFSAENRLEVRALEAMQVALDEVLSNVVRHGYGADGREGLIELRFRYHDGLLEVGVIDDAEPFNPLEADEPDTSSDLVDRPIGGLGNLVVRELMDAVEYRRTDGRNHVVMRKQGAVARSDG